MQTLLFAMALFLAVTGAEGAPPPQALPKSVDATAFVRAYSAWTDSHAAPMHDVDVSADVLETRAKQGDAKAYFLLGTRAQFQQHPSMAYDLYLKAMALGLTVPVVAFLPLVELQAAPPEHPAEPGDVLMREHELAWALVGVMRGDEYGARLANLYVRGYNRLGEVPLNSSQITVACKLAAFNYQKVQVTRRALGRLPFTVADNAAQTAFLDDANPWPVRLCPGLPIPEVRCVQVRLVGSLRGVRVNPGEKAYQCSASSPTVGISETNTNPPALVSAAPGAEVMPAPLAIPGPPEIMKATSTEPLDNQNLYAPDSGSDSDPERQYHFTVGSRMYVIESAGAAVVNTPDAWQKTFEVPSAPIFIDGPVYYALYHGDPILMYQTDMPGETPKQQARDALVYLVRIDADTLKLKWTISGIPPGVTPGVIHGYLLFVGSTGFLGVVDLDTGKYRWCLSDSRALPTDVKPPFIRGREVVLESAKPNAHGGYDYVAVNLDTQTVSTNLPDMKLRIITDDCPYFR